MFALRLHLIQNEAEVCDVLCAALARMLEERSAPSSQPYCNGPIRGDPRRDTTPPTDTSDGSGPIAGGEIAEEAATVPDGEGSRGGGGGGTRWILPEDRRKAVELLKKGEERVLRLSLERVEVRWMTAFSRSGVFRVVGVSGGAGAAGFIVQEVM